MIQGKAISSSLQDVTIEDLLGRDEIPSDPQLMDQEIRGKSVMVTGAGGSIGSELCREILKHEPRRLILYEISEFQDPSRLHLGDTESCILLHKLKIRTPSKKSYLR